MRSRRHLPEGLRIMMSKLLQQEYLTTRKALATITGWLLLVGVVSLIPVAIPVPYVSNVCFLLAMVSFAGIAPVLLAYLIYTYWQTMYGRRGYFTMTLPVRGRVIYWAKTVYTLVVVALGAVATAVGAWLLTASMDIGARVSIGTMWGQLWHEVVGSFGDAAWSIVLIVLVQAMAYILAIPAMTSVSAQARFNHLGVGAPVIGGVLLYLTIQVTSLLAMMFLPVGMVLVGPESGHIVAQGMWAEIIEMVQNPAAQSDVPQILGLGMLVSATVITVTVVWWGVRSIERRTSLR